jgi:hypothetical protein
VKSDILGIRIEYSVKRLVVPSTQRFEKQRHCSRLRWQRQSSLQRWAYGWLGQQQPNLCWARLDRDPQG